VTALAIMPPRFARVVRPEAPAAPLGSSTLARGVQDAATSDADLVARIARGDEAALGDLYDRHSGAAYGLALRIVRDGSLAEDAVQEAFLAVWRGAARFDATRARVSTWLLSLVHHKAVDLVRREQARPAAPTDVLPEVADPADVGGEVVSRAQRGEIERALRSLSPAQREILELAYFGGYTQSELADRLGEPIGTVKSRTHAALARLRTVLQGSGFET
jgi:RNA polymerase sigma-70 factor (ECF subfamily)